MKTFKFTSALILICFLCISCNDFAEKQVNANASPSELLNADKDFSAMANEKGMKKAFMHFMAKEGVLLRPENYPIIGADAIEYVSQINDTDYKVAWKPMKADISQDGDLGYTYGIYEVTVQDTVIKGTYVNVWKKQNGEWRFVLNSGNQGVEPEQN